MLQYRDDFVDTDAHCMQRSSEPKEPNILNIYRSKEKRNGLKQIFDYFFREEDSNKVKEDWK